MWLWLSFGVAQARLSATAPAEHLTMDLKLLPQEHGAACPCLDGTPPAYWIVRGKGPDANKFILNYEGGGWCASLDDCAGRTGGRAARAICPAPSTLYWHPG